MQKGQVVTALLYGGEEAERRVVKDNGSVVVLCSEDEYQFALAAKREPTGIGFPREDVVEHAIPAKKKSARSEQDARRSEIAGD